MKEEEERTEAVAMAAKWKEYKAKAENRAQGDKPKKDIVCFNCDRAGHIKADCWREGGGKAGEGPNQGGGKNKKRGRGKRKGDAKKAAAGTQDSPVDHAFAAISPGVAFKSSSASGTVVRFLDSAASQHFEPDRSNFIKIEPCAPFPVQIADGEIQNSTEKGTILFSYHLNGETKTITLSNVYYTPWFEDLLISLGYLRENADLIFCNEEKGYGSLKKADGTVIFRVPARNNLYPLTTWRPITGKGASAVRKPITLHEAHLRLNHIGYDAIRHLVKTDQATGLEVDLSTPEIECKTCIEAKATRTVIPKAFEGQRSTSFGQIVSSDVWGPSKTAAKGGYNYFSTWTDDYTRFTHVFLQKTKAETFEKYQAYEVWMSTQYGRTVGTLHSDRGGEYTSTEFDQYLAKKGTKRSLTAHDTPERNGVAERLNYTLANLVRAALLGSGLPKSLWGYALMYATWLKNRVPHKAIESEGKTPYEMVYGEKPDLSRAREFGCKVMVKVKAVDKLDARAKEGRYLGPSSETSDGFHVYWPKTRRVTVERNVRFLDGSAFEGEQGVTSGVTTANPFEIQPSKTAKIEPDEPSTQDTTPTSSSAAPESPKASNVPLPSSPSQSSTTSDVPDPLEGIEEPETMPSGPRRSQREPKPSAYVRRVLAGKGETKTLPTGMRAPKGMAAFAVGPIGHAKSAINVDMIGRQPRTIEEAK